MPGLAGKRKGTCKPEPVQTQPPVLFLETRLTGLRSQEVFKFVP